MEEAGADMVEGRKQKAESRKRKDGRKGEGTSESETPPRTSIFHKAGSILIRLDVKNRRLQWEKLKASTAILCPAVATIK
jgi:hypothetical protein